MIDDRAARGSTDVPSEAALDEPLTRRRFVGRTVGAASGMAIGVAGGASWLAACTGAPEHMKESASAAGRTLRISNWPLYIDQDTPALFEQVTGIQVSYTEDVNDNNAFFAKIAEPLRRRQSIGRDIIVVSDWMVARLIRLGYCTPLDDQLFPNKRLLADDLRDVAFDPGRRYSVPWMLGMTGLAYNRRKTGRDLTSVRDLFDPAFKGQVTMLTELRDTVGLIMLAQGRAPEHATDADVESACAIVEQYRKNGQIRVFTNDYAEDLASGNIAVALGWSGDIAGLAADNPDLRFMVPEEGGLLFSDCMVVPVTSDRLSAAMAWMNYVYQPSVSARIVEATLYISPVQGTDAELAKVAPALVSNPLVNPPAALRARLHDFRPLSDEEERRYTERYFRAMGI